MKTVKDVREFWENSPLWTGETSHQAGTREFFEEHRKTVVQDCFAGALDPRTIPEKTNQDKILDLGCGPGFWVIELGQATQQEIHAADLTEAAIQLARRRTEIFGVRAKFAVENAEELTFPSGTFSHVNCQGVIHHTPNTAQCVSEIARVLRTNGTASISVYYKNVLLRNWKILSWVGKVLFSFGARLKGRGREKIFAEDDINEIVRLYDGGGNPIGKAYSKNEFIRMLEPHFEVKEIFYHFFPARSLPFSIPAFLHRFLDRKMPFMIYATLKKKSKV